MFPKPMPENIIGMLTNNEAVETHVTELSTVSVPVQNTVIAVVVAVPVPVVVPVAVKTVPIVLLVAPTNVKSVEPIVVIV